MYIVTEARSFAFVRQFHVVNYSWLRGLNELKNEGKYRMSTKKILNC
jgi:hypothetical protein